MIVPCYNVELYLERCLKSILNQTIGRENLELILVNDASTDHTLSVMLDYEKQYEEDILVVNCDKNGKQGTARNIGLQYATCEYVGFVDADDWIESTMYEKLYTKAKELDCDRVGCFYDRVSCEGEAEKNSKSRSKDKTEKYINVCNDRDRKEYLTWKEGGGIWSSIYRRSVIVDNQIFFPENLIYEDNYWSALMRFYEKNIYVTNEVLYHYFTNPNSVTLRRNNTDLLDRLVVETMKMQEYKKRGIYSKFQEQLDKEFIELYWKNSLHTFFFQLDYFPVGLLKEMQKTVKEEVSMQLLQKIKDVGKWYYSLLYEENITQEELNGIQTRYVNECMKMANGKNIFEGDM